MTLSTRSSKPNTSEPSEPTSTENATCTQEKKYANPKAVRFVDVTRRTSLPIGSRLTKLSNKQSQASTYGKFNDNKRTNPSAGSGTLKTNKMMRVNILILRPISSRLLIIIALRSGKWFMKKIVSVARGEIHKIKTYAKRRPFFIKLSVVFTRVYRHICPGSTKISPQRHKCGPISRNLTSSLSTMAFTSREFWIIQIGLKTYSSSTKSFWEPSNKFLLTWWIPTSDIHKI